MISDKGHFRIAASEDGAVLLDMYRGTITTLNATGAFIWQAAERGKSDKEITDELVQETGTAAESIRPDVLDFLATLKREKLLPSSYGVGNDQ